MSLSPCERFLQIFDKYDISDGRTTLLEFPSCKKLKEFQESQATNFIAKENYPLLKFTSDEALMFRYNKKGVEIYGRELEQLGIIDTGAINLFSLSKISKEKDYLLVSFSLDVSAVLA